MMIFTFLFHTLVEVYVSILLLRFWIGFLGTYQYEDLIVWIVRMTQKPLIIVYRIMPIIRGSNVRWAALALAFLISILKYCILNMYVITDIKYQALMWGAISFFKTALHLVIFVVVLRAISSFMGTKGSYTYILYSMTEPLLSPVRKLINIRSDLDLAAILFALILYFCEYVIAHNLGLSWYLL